MNNEQNEKRGRFISELRKACNMTQKELAEKLEVTDKAVSKWERGISCPDVALILPLAKVLGVTAAEMLSGERNQAPEETVIEQALLYSGQSSENRVGRIRRNLLVVLSVLFIIGAAICLICDICISRRLTWSPLVIVSLLSGWILLLPFFRAKGNTIRRILAVLTVIIIPYLLVMSVLLEVPEVFSIGSGCAVVSLTGLWCIYLICMKMSFHKLCAVGASLLVLLVVNWCIKAVIDFYIPEDGSNSVVQMVTTVTVVCLSGICFIMDHLKTRKNKI